MSLEAVVTINDLVITNPLPEDFLSEGDDHLRNIKTVLKGAFPNLAGRMWRHQSKTVDYTILPTDNFTAIRVSTAGRTITYPPAPTLGDGFINFIHADGNSVILDALTPSLIEGAASYTMLAGSKAFVLGNGTKYTLFADFPLGVFTAAGDILQAAGPGTIAKLSIGLPKQILTVNDAGTALTYATMFTTGDVKFTLKTIADPGWILCDDGSIGNAASGAQTRAHADTAALFTLLWENVPPAYTSISGGRGLSAAADFAANKTISLTKMLGRALAVAGVGSGLSNRELGSTLGSQATSATVTGPTALSIAQMPLHGHAYRVSDGQETAPDHNANSGGFVTGNKGPVVNNAAFAGVPSSAVGQAIGGTGEGGTHTHTIPAISPFQPTSFLNVMIKL